MENDDLNKSIITFFLFAAATPGATGVPSSAPSKKPTSRDGTIALLFFIGLIVGSGVGSFALFFYLKKKNRIVAEGNGQAEALLSGSAPTTQ